MLKNKFKVGDRVKNISSTSCTSGDYGKVIGFHRKIDIMFVKLDDGSFIDIDDRDVAYEQYHLKSYEIVLVEKCCCKCKCN